MGKRRRDGRLANQLRPMAAEFGVLNAADGSARLTMGAWADAVRRAHLRADSRRGSWRASFHSSPSSLPPPPLPAGDTKVLVAVYGPRPGRSLRHENPHRSTLEVSVVLATGPPGALAPLAHGVRAAWCGHAGVAR
jgi:hypothetical protein